MRFSHDLKYDASPDEVHAMLGEPEFREKVCAAMRALRHTVTITGDADAMTVVVDQTQPAKGIPSFATKFVGSEIRIVQTEEWSGTTEGELTVTIPGKPGHLKATIALTGDGSSTVETVTGNIKVNIPLVGGKLEGLISDMLGAALDTEERVGRVWLAGDR